MSDPEPDETDPRPPPALPRARRIATPRARVRRRHIGLVQILGVTATAFAVSLLLLMLVGQSVSAPNWLRARMETRLDTEMPGLSVQLGGVALRLEGGWSPRLSLRDVRLRDPEGRDLVTLSDVDATFLAEPLLRRRLQTGSVTLSGIQLDLRRREDGQLDFAFGDMDLGQGRGVSLGGLVDGLDALLTGPALKNLERIEINALTLRYEDRQSGRSWVADGGRLTLVRAGDHLRLRGDLAVLSGGADVATMAVTFESRLGDTAGEISVSLSDLRARDIAALGPATAWMNVLRAPISGSLRASIREDGALGPFSATLQIGPGVVQPVTGARPIPFDSLRSYFSYAPRDRLLRFDELSVRSKWVSARAEGAVFLGDPEAGLRQREMLGQLRITDIAANPEGLFDSAIALDAARADLRLRLDPFQLTLGEVRLRDGDDLAVLRGEVSADAAGWHLGLDARMARLSPARLLHFWPEGVKPRSRDWIAKNVEAGEMHDIQAALRLEPGARPDIYLGFDFTGMRARFMRTMPLIEEGSGHATLLRDRFAIRAEGGYVPAPEGGQVALAGTTFVVPDVRIKPAPAQVRLDARSSITAALSLLDRPPLNVMQKARRPVTLAEGRLHAQGTIDLVLKPRLPPNEVRYALSGRAEGVRSDQLVPGRVLTAPALDIEVDTSGIRIGGAGQIDGVPIRGDWSMGLGVKADGTSRVEGRVELSQRFVDAFRIGLPPGSLSGAGQGEVDITFARGKAPAFALRSDLAGLGLRLAALNWSIGPKTTGALSIDGTLGSPPAIDALSLRAPGLSAEGRLSIGADGALERASFARVQAGSWLDAPVDLVGRGAGRAPAVRITGGRVDMRGLGSAGGGSGSAGGGGGPITLALERLQVSDKIAIAPFRGEFTNAAGLDGSFEGLVNGSAAVTGRVVPRNGRSAFRILSQDAGAVMRALGVLKQAREGALDLTLVPGQARGSYDGHLKASAVRLKDAPAMAALLSAVSIVGLLEQLGGAGILFNEIEARFRLTSDRLVVSESSAVGASMGISMDGVYALANGAMDMQGVISPIYMINGIGSIFTRKGEGLLGFSYRLMGTAAKPQVRVNPLSILTPGMFREIFRRPPPPEPSQ